jgi:periplasmic copper chaperone A
MMLMDLKKPLKQGEMIKGSLTFQKAGSVPIEFKVEGLAAKSSNDTEAGQDHGHAH